MIQLAEGDFIPLDRFPLKWRWTDPKYQSFPVETLKDIRPLTASKARAVWEIGRQFVHSDALALAPEEFDSVFELDTGALANAQVPNWLASHGIPPELAVVVSWSIDWAASLPFGVFCDCWDDFCYPSSDDVLICPFSVDWFIFYHHEERLSFGHRRKVEPGASTD